MSGHLSLRSGNPVLSKETFTNTVLSSDKMTIEGTVNKTAISLLLLVGTGYFTFDVISPVLLIGAGIGGFILALVTIFKKEWAPITVPLYAILEGALLGGISYMYNSSYNGIVTNAILLTVGILVSLLMAYRSGYIKATMESLYVKEFVNDSNYIMNFLNKTYLSFDEGIQNVESYESYNGFNSVIGQYGDITIFMNLSLAKILQEQGNSEKESFKIIFEDYWKTNPNDSNWKIKFEEVFGISTSEFYQRLNDFKTNPENLVPEISLSEIFEKE